MDYNCSSLDVYSHIWLTEFTEILISDCWRGNRSREEFQAVWSRSHRVSFLYIASPDACFPCHVNLHILKQILCMFLVCDEGRNGGGWVWWPGRRSKDWEKVEIDEEKEFGNQRKSLVDSQIILIVSIGESLQILYEFWISWLSFSGEHYGSCNLKI